MHKFKKGKIVKRHYFNCLNKREKIFIAGMITCSFIRGIWIGMYLGEK